MIRFRQKEFIAWMPLLMGTGTVVSVGSAVKSHSDNKKNQEELDKQNALIKSQNAKLEKINEEVKKQKEFSIGAITFGIDMATMAGEGVDSNISGSKVESSMDDQKHLLKEQQRLIGRIKKKNAAVGNAVEATKSYSAGSILKDVGKAAKEAFGGGFKNNVLMGLGAAGAGYGIGKFVQHDMKKNNLEVNSETGQLQQKTYNATVTPQQAATTEIKKSGLRRLLPKGVGNVVMGGVFEAGDAMGYLADKRQAKDMAAMTQQQKAYAIPGMSALKNIGSKVVSSVKNPKDWWHNQELYKNWKSTTTGFINNISSMGLGGKANVQKFAQGLSNSTNSTVKKVGDWMITNPNAANLATTIPLAGAGSLAWTGTQKGTEKALRTVDPNAYTYKDAKNKPLQQ